MTYYRLLRDNKETGPFSEEELIAKGFKPYDLIWVEGKSAGWRYPSEIPSFKSFAPAIEEQPYDRFYKKQPAQKHFAEEVAPQPVYKTEKTYIPESRVESKPNITAPAPEYNIQSLPGRHIHVTLPSGNTVNLSTLVSKKEPSTVKEEVIARKTEVIEPVATPAQQPAVKKETKIAAPVLPIGAYEEDLHDTSAYQPQTFVYGQQQPASSGFSWGLIAAAVIGFATLIGLGIMIGLTLAKQPSTIGNADELAVRKLKQKTLDNTGNKTVVSPVVTDEPTNVSNEPLQQSGNATSNKELVQNAVVKNSIIPENNAVEKGNKKVNEEKGLVGKIKDPAGSNQAETIVSTKPLSAPVNIEKTLSLTNNDFKTGAFGGISGLKYTLFNGSRFPLESVEIEVNYIQANDKIFKTERLVFKDVPSGSQITIDAPSSSRGVKLSSRIIKINSREASANNNTTAKS